MCTQYEIIATCYDKKGRRLSSATNSYSITHPLQAKYAAKVGHQHRIYLHAEIAAIIKAKKKQIHKIKVERYDSKGNPKLAAPCPICQEAIRIANIKFVEYTT
jgi:deoxycytidylate deaminase